MYPTCCSANPHHPHPPTPTPYPLTPHPTPFSLPPDRCCRWLYQQESLSCSKLHFALWGSVKLTLIHFCFYRLTRAWNGGVTLSGSAGGSSGFDGPAKALLLPVTVRAPQIGNPEEIICKEHVHQCCKIQPSQRGEIRKKQTALYKTKAIQSLGQNLYLEHFRANISVFPGDVSKRLLHRWIRGTVCSHWAACQKCVVHILLIFRQKLKTQNISLTTVWLLSVTRVLIWGGGVGVGLHYLKGFDLVRYNNWLHVLK